MDRFVSPAEAAVLENLLPEGLTRDMKDVALCLFEALVLADERAGDARPADSWKEQLVAWARQVLMQLQRLADQRGGYPLYIAKGIAVHLSERDRAICARFNGTNYRELARTHGLTEVRVRQIVDTWSREQFLLRQGNLPGFDSPL